VELYSIPKKNEVMSLSGKWIKLEIILLSEISQSHTQTNHVFFHMLNLGGHENKRGKLTTTRDVEGEKGAGGRAEKE
jgi:hypothetical protein